MARLHLSGDEPALLHSDDDNRDYNGDDSEFNPSEDGPFSTFHPFARLPPELRYRVWELFCPDLTPAKPRVLYIEACTHTKLSQRGTNQANPPNVPRAEFTSTRRPR